MLYVWFIIALFFLIMEMGHPGLFLFLSFSFGACMSAIMSLLISSLIMQCLIFVAGAGIAFLVLKQLIVDKHSFFVHTNLFALQGKRGWVQKEITSTIFGQVKVGGEVWSARSVHDEIIAVDTWVEIVAVRGAHVVVQKLDNISSKKGL